MRSDQIKRGFERAPHRSLLRATGSIESEDDFKKPFIAIANSYTDCIPGHGCAAADEPGPFPLVVAHIASTGRGKRRQFERSRIMRV